MAVEVRPITFPRDTMAFCKVWWRIYEGDPHWVPPLLFERKDFFNPAKNPYYKQATVQAFIAYKDGVAVGTIGACVDRKLQERYPRHATFGFYEIIDDAEVARALLDAARAWATEQGCVRLMGPFNWSSNHEFGLLVDGFDSDPCVANPHNLAYYPKIYREIGLEPIMTWYAYWMDYGPEPPRVAKIAERLLERRPEIVLRDVQLDRWDDEMALLKEIYNDAWHDNWGHVAIEMEEFDYLAKNFKPMVASDLCYVVTVHGKPAGVSVTFPNYNQLAKKMNGRLFPFGWYHWVFGKKSVDELRVFILGVKHEFQHLPIGAPMYARTWKAGRARKVVGAEASLILHDNVGMRGALEKLGAYIYKTYQCFHVELSDEAPPVTHDVGQIIPGEKKGKTLVRD